MKRHVATSTEHSTEFLLQHVMKLTVLFNQMCASSGVSNPLEEKMWLTNIVIRQEPPWVIKMTGFQKKKMGDVDWYSNPVYSHFGGYKMCVCVYANGHGSGHGTHVSVYANLMRGVNDDSLKWPFNGTIKVSLLNQLADGQHHTLKVWLPEHSVPKETSRRVTERQRALGWGLSKFISQQDLVYKGDKNCQYLKDNTLFFRVDCFEPKMD